MKRPAFLLLFLAAVSAVSSLALAGSCHPPRRTYRAPVRRTVYRAPTYRAPTYRRAHHATEIVVADVFFDPFNFAVKDVFVFNPPAPLLVAPVAPVTPPVSATSVAPAPPAPPAGPALSTEATAVFAADEAAHGGAPVAAPAVDRAALLAAASSSLQRCVSCHSSPKGRGNVTLFDGGRLALAGATWKGVLDAVTRSEGRMPPSGSALSAEQLAPIRQLATLP